MSNAIAAMGLVFKMGDGGSPSETFTAIAEVRDFNGPGLSTDVIDVTPHSTSSNFRRKIPGLQDGGEVTFDLNFIPTAATHKDDAGGLLDAWKNQLVRNFQILWPDSGQTTWTIRGFVSGFEPSASVEGELTASVTITVDGEPTLV